VAITPFGKARAPGATPLFDPGDEEATTSAAAAKVTANDEALALALQREELGEGENVADPELARALALSRAEAEEKEKGKEKEKEKEKAAVEATEKEGGTPPPLESDEDEFEEVSLVPSGGGTPAPIVLDDSEDDLELVEAAAPAPTATGQKNPRELTEALIKDSVSAPQARAAPSARTTQAARPSAASLVAMSRPPDVVSVQPSPLPEIHPVQHFSSDEDDDEFEEVAAPAAVSQLSPAEVPQPPPAPSRPSLTEVVKQPVPHRGPSVPSPEPQTAVQRDPWPWSFEHDPFAGMRQDRAPSPEEDTDGPFADMRIERGAPSPSPPPQLIDTEREPEPARLSLPPARSFTYDEDSDDSDDPIEWSRSPTPQPRSDTLQRSYSAAQSAASEPDDEDEQMAPADMAVEEDDYARFLAQIKNRDLNEVRGEIDDEIRILNQQAKAAMRDSDEITQAMVVQIQTLLRHFGIPYITAPMEAEAQCAKLAELGLVDGIITDDSDVFLFGGTQCFKNIFNDAKFAECFLASDIERELSLTRDRLVALSYLLGSDYTLGLPGVGPVMALELLSNFAGPDGLVHFRDWWLRVQNSTDTEEESNTKWKKSFVSLAYPDVWELTGRKNALQTRSRSPPHGLTPSSARHTSTQQLTRAMSPSTGVSPVLPLCERG
jgi:DNA excision repair protein ERCC-5